MVFYRPRNLILAKEIRPATAMPPLAILSQNHQYVCVCLGARTQERKLLLGLFRTHEWLSSSCQSCLRTLYLYLIWLQNCCLVSAFLKLPPPSWMASPWISQPANVWSGTPAHLEGSWLETCNSNTTRQSKQSAVCPRFTRTESFPRHQQMERLLNKVPRFLLQVSQLINAILVQALLAFYLIRTWNIKYIRHDFCMKLSSN